MITIVVFDEPDPSVGCQYDECPEVARFGLGHMTNDGVQDPRLSCDEHVADTARDLHDPGMVKW